MIQDLLQKDTRYTPQVFFLEYFFECFVRNRRRTVTRFGQSLRRGVCTFGSAGSFVSDSSVVLYHHFSVHTPHREHTKFDLLFLLTEYSTYNHLRLVQSIRFNLWCGCTPLTTPPASPPTSNQTCPTSGHCSPRHPKQPLPTPEAFSFSRASGGIVACGRRLKKAQQKWLRLSTVTISSSSSTTTSSTSLQSSPQRRRPWPEHCQ